MGRRRCRSGRRASGGPRAQPRRASLWSGCIPRAGKCRRVCHLVPTSATFKSILRRADSGRCNPPVRRQESQASKIVSAKAKSPLFVTPNILEYRSCQAPKASFAVLLPVQLSPRRLTEMLPMRGCLLLLLVALFSPSALAQNRATGTPPENVILDTDVGDDCGRCLWQSTSRWPVRSSTCSASRVPGETPLLQVARMIDRMVCESAGRTSVAKPT